MTEDQSEPTYRQPLAELEHRLATDDTLRHDLGKDFIGTGQQEYALLRSLGLADGQLVVDIGCGAGRLAYQLAPFPRISYVGSDLVPRLLASAQDLCRRADLRFVHSDGSTIPCEDAKADFICFFSVFEHLHYEDIFHYFLGASAKLKPGGLLVMSFLEFRVPAHWASFIAGVDHATDAEPLNQFIDRDAIDAWASHSGFKIHWIAAGDGGRSVAVLQSLAFRAAPSIVRKKSSLRMTNTSSRVFVGAGENVFVQGLVLQGTGAKSYLLRAVGPTLENFNVKAVLSAPALTVYNSEGTVIASGRGWDASLTDTFTLVGAFALPIGSADAALLVTLTDGNYSISISGEGSGVVLAEIYELPVTRDRLGNAG